MQTDSLPRKDREFRQFAHNYVSRIAADPQLYGIDGDSVALLVTRTEEFDQQYTMATAPCTSTPTRLVAKDEARKVLTKAIRQNNRRVRAKPGLAPQDVISLGLKVRPKRLSKIPAPTSRPVLSFVPGVRSSMRHEIRLADEFTRHKKAKPRGAKGATFVVAVAPPGATSADVDLADPKLEWRFAGLCSTDRMTIEYLPHERGRVVFIRAAWFNRRGQGPWSDPINALIAE